MSTTYMTKCDVCGKKEEHEANGQGRPAGWVTVRVFGLPGMSSDRTMDVCGECSGAVEAFAEARRQSKGSEGTPRALLVSALGYAGVNVRKAPNIESDVVAWAINGSALTVIECGARWHRVRTPDGAEGFVCAVDHLTGKALYVSFASPT